MGYVREALEELDEPMPTEVSEWIKKEKGVEIAPKGSGLYAERIGYHSKQKWKDGENRRVHKPDGG